MNRLLATLPLAAALVIAVASPASAADSCRPRPGEHQLARSAQAVVLAQVVRQSQHFPVQTIIGCSRRSGKRRTIDTLHRRTTDDPTRLVGLRLAGTRVAYVMTTKDEPTIIAEDAIHGGRRHDVGALSLSSDIDPTRITSPLSWAVDAQGDVAWISGAEPTAPSAFARPTLGIWRAGLGRRGVDSHAALDGLTLRDGKVGWRRNGTPHTVDLTAVAPSRCGPQQVLAGTLEVDLAQTVDHVPTACLRSTGTTVPITPLYPYAILDINGPYVLAGWYHVSWEGVVVVDLLRGTATAADPFDPYHYPPTDDTVSQNAVITDHGSIAWLRDSGLWVRDGAGTRKVAEAGAGTGPLYRDGSTVTWSGGGPTVTLNP
jgi:hypothetical protein